MFAPPTAIYTHAPGLTPLSITFQLCHGCRFYWWGGTMVHGENHRPVTSHWQALSHKVVNLQKLGSNSISLRKRVFI